LKLLRCDSIACIPILADDDGDMVDDVIDQKGLTKKDIHTLNEQRRRDLIKVLF